MTLGSRVGLMDRGARKKLSERDGFGVAHPCQNLVIVVAMLSSMGVNFLFFIFYFFYFFGKQQER